MEGIGAKAGFPSKSTFFSVFKKETGKTPKEFLEQRMG
jgi:AraC-like DNA-binding protein